MEDHIETIKAGPPKRTASLTGVLGRLARNRQGAISVEFAMMFPLLLLSYLFIVDVTVFMDDQRRIKHMGQSLAQIAATFPAFDQNARAALDYNLNAQLNYLAGRQVDVELMSLTLRDGSPQPVFEPVVLHGGTTGVSWQSEFKDMGYRYGENVIMVSAKASRTPLLLKFLGPLLVSSHVAQTQSYYSRPYVYEEKIADPNYYNMP